MKYRKTCSRSQECTWRSAERQILVLKRWRNKQRLGRISLKIVSRGPSRGLCNTSRSRVLRPTAELWVSAPSDKIMFGFFWCRIPQINLFISLNWMVTVDHSWWLVKFRNWFLLVRRWQVTSRNFPCDVTDLARYLFRYHSRKPSAWENPAFPFREDHLLTFKANMQQLQPVTQLNLVRVGWSKSLKCWTSFWRSKQRSRSTQWTLTISSSLCTTSSPSSSWSLPPFWWHASSTSVTQSIVFTMLEEIIQTTSW